MLRLMVILGPTASGKTRLATQMAHLLDGAILSADSRQVYRGMDIGTGKDLDEYQVAGKPIPHHLIDIRDAGERYNINDYYNDFVEAYWQIVGEGQQPILCGGSGLYIEIALRGNPLAAVPINPELREKLVVLPKPVLQQTLAKYPAKLRKQADTSSHKRLIRAIEIADYLKAHDLPERSHPDFQPILFGTHIEREERRRKITIRLKERFKNGLIEEVEGLLSQGVAPETLAYYGLEYKWILAYLQGKVDYQTLFDRLNVAIHQFAKRQMTWFRKMEKEGWQIHWINTQLPLIDQCNEVQKIWSN